MAGEEPDDEIKRGPKGGRKHTPGRGHDRKSKRQVKKRYGRKKERERAAELEHCRQQWRVWDSLSDEVKKMRTDLTPDCPRPDDE